ncbi:MAG TPA: Uma2 family endonuclease [Thermodesulfobacteriota bacterium]|nr:Uma2 family endonuclease [Thermodesulfobacteriota bacterium]
MGYPNRKENNSYTYKDYLEWPEEERWEMIEGVAYHMTPSPSRSHQKISAALVNAIYPYLKGKNCEVYYAPFDVRLPEGDEENNKIKTVVQPDIVVICDPSKLDEKGCKGSPDLIMEILSPSTASIDYISKLNLYEKNQVSEYWIIHPMDKIVMVYRLLENGNYGRAEVYSEKDRVKVGIFDDFVIDLKEIFKD